jgi:hypothetical protein
VFRDSLGQLLTGILISDQSLGVSDSIVRDERCQSKLTASVVLWANGRFGVLVKMGPDLY